MVHFENIYHQLNLIISIFHHTFENNSWTVSATSHETPCTCARCVFGITMISSIVYNAVDLKVARRHYRGRRFHAD